jgi:hypothetical protein
MTSLSPMHRLSVTSRASIFQSLIPGLNKEEQEAEETDVKKPKKAGIDALMIGMFLSRLISTEKEKPKPIESFKDLTPDQEKIYLQEHILNVLNKPPVKRLRTQIQVLQQSCQDKPFFRRFREAHGDSGLRELLTLCYHEFLPKHDVLFEINRPGYEFYIILDGEVGLFDSYPVEAKALMMENGAKAMREPELKSSGGSHRSKSNFIGTVKMEKNLNTVVRPTTAGLFVFDNGTHLCNLKEFYCERSSV